MNKRSSTLFASTLALSLMAATGSVMADDQPTRTDNTRTESQEPVSDTWITTKVKADLLATKNVPGTEVKVETVNGVVTLSGTVDSKAEHDRAISVAKGIKGVKDVDASGLTVAKDTKATR
jgi:hyperosmotically inducible protein